MPERNLTVLEIAIDVAKSGDLSDEALYWTLAASTLFVPSGVEIREKLDELQPLLYDFEGQEMLAVLTDPDMLGVLEEQAPYLLSLTGSQVVEMLPSGTGLMVNPGHDRGFAMQPRAVIEFRESFFRTDT